jgi:hypothetical protein
MAIRQQMFRILAFGVEVFDWLGVLLCCLHYKESSQVEARSTSGCLVQYLTYY